MSMFVRANSYSWNKANQSEYKNSIVFIEDSKQIYSNGVYYGGENNGGLLLEKITFSEESILLNPDKFYVSDTILETLDITLNGDTARMNTYFVEFLCNNTCVILPSSIKWKNNIVPDFTKTAIMTIKIQDDAAYLIDCRPLDLCVTFISEEDNSSIGLSKLSTYQTLEYSRDKSNWSNMSTITNISLNNGDKVYVRGVLSGDNTSSNYTQFKMSGRIAASGNCNAIWNYQDLNSPLKAYCGYYMFRDCTSLTTAPELPATTLAMDCYGYMFFDCNSLTTAPKLPATTLVEGCYCYMFYGCTSLTTAPKLPATELDDFCYSNMFYLCSSLTVAPALPATTLAERCYQSMFYGCSSLTTAPELPATTLANCCYCYMFENCDSLLTAPEILPATELGKDCYNSMFDSCTSLTTAPELPATELAERCYSGMFWGCTSLTTAPELPATELAAECYYGMFFSCASLTTAPELPATTLADYCYWNMFNNCTNLNYIKCLATDISATGCTTDWVNKVSSAGTFVKHPNMNLWSRGVYGIPSGWRVENAEI